MKIFVSQLCVVICMCAYALTPISDAEEFYKAVSYSPDIKLGEWNGRCSLCVEKAKETGYLMFFMMTSLKQFKETKSYRERVPLGAQDFIEHNIGRQSFCDLINDYKYIILCYGDYSDKTVKALKEELYGYDGGSMIYTEDGAKYTENHNGYAVRHTTYDLETETTYEQWCDDIPSLHLIKFEKNGSATIIFHVYGPQGTYDVDFSPYWSTYTIPYDMNNRTDLFAPWFKLYLDMYPVTERISEYENKTVLTKYVYETITLPVTETVNPTYEQIALHRDNILFRQVTMLRDLAVKERICDDFSKFDDRTVARNGSGRWYINHDDSLSGIQTGTSDGSVSIDIIPSTNCMLGISQSIGSGFLIEGYDIHRSVIVTNMFTVGSKEGDLTFTPVTNELFNVSSEPFFKTNAPRFQLVEFCILSNKMYRISSNGNPTFDTFYAK